MNQQPDKLFRDKLEGYQRPAPASAWEKIAEAQSKKNDKWLWMKVAASITLLASAGYLLFGDSKTSDLSDQTPTKPAEERTIERSSPVGEKPDEEVVPQTTTPSATPDNGSTQIAKNNKAIKTVTPSEEKAQPTLVSEDEQKDFESVQPYINENIASATETVVQPQLEQTPVHTDEAPKNITLVYSAKDVEEYLDKKALAEATSDNKKSSTFKKLLRKAEDLTNNQDPFGELRQKKNEILALNFKSEKQRGQNK